MNYKKISLLLLVAVLATITHSLSHDKWECTHEKEDQPVPEVMDIEEDFNPNGNNHTGRLLSSYSSLRMYGYYGNLGSSTFATYIEDELIPPILDYFSAALKTKYPVSGTFKVSSSSICGITTPSVLKNGVTADFVYILSTSSSSSYVASSSTCSTASSTHRPLVGHTTISSYYMSASSDPVVHERNMICIMHEVVHTLGFSKSLYSYWIDSNGDTLTDHVLTKTLDGYSTTVIDAEPLTSLVQSYFGCSTAAGAYMENTGSSGTAGCHFERRQYGFEMMTSGLIYEMQVSNFTLALLESTGWYVPDYSYADPFFFGQGEGCSFLTGTCSTTYSEFCSSSSRSCTVPGRSGGSCASDSRSDGCKFVHPNYNYDCGNTGASSYARLSTLQTFGRNTGSKCFEGTLASSSAGSQTTFCFTYNCTGSGSSTKLTINVGSKSVVCSSSGTKSVSGYAGTITCPDPETFCDTVGEKICPRNCMGRGTCVSGYCSCDSGYAGEDCALNSS